jgi:hypothetical protein
MRYAKKNLRILVLCSTVPKVVHVLKPGIAHTVLIPSVKLIGLIRKMTESAAKQFAVVRLDDIVIPSETKPRVGQHCYKKNNTEWDKIVRGNILYI